MTALDDFFVSMELPVLGSSNGDFYGCIEVNGDDFVSGTYAINDTKSNGLSEEPVYKHQERDSYIFYDPDEGWKIGDQDSMTTYDFWYKSKKMNISHLIFVPKYVTRI